MHAIVLSEPAANLTLGRARPRRAEGALNRFLHLGVNIVAKMDLSFLWEGFALTSGVPPPMWRMPPDQEVAMGQSDQKRLPYREVRRGQVLPRKFITKRSAGDTDLPVRRFRKVLLTTLEALR